MTTRTWNALIEGAGILLGVGMLVLLLWTILFAGGCGRVDKVALGDSWSDEDAQDDPEVGEDGLEAPEADYVELLDDDCDDVAGDEGTVEEPAPCGGLDEDCDGDGWTPAGGDCCDELPGVHPGADWATEAYACPEESWDWDCSGEVEVQVEDIGDGLEALLPDTGCDGVLGSLECNAADGWYPAPECGVEAEYLHCFWYSTPYTYGCYPHPATWAGTVACR